MHPIAVVFVVSTLTALLVTPAVLRALSARRGWAVRPGRDGAEPRAPRFGGVAVCAAMTAGVVAGALLGGAGGADAARFYPGVLTAAWILFLAGVLDDLYDLPPRTKLLAQCTAALVAYALGFRVEAFTFGAGESVQVGALSLPLTVLWIVGVTNAFNLIDGLDGLATGIALVALATTFGVSLLLGNLDVALVCAALGGALLGFLRYNLRPARIFLGDSGSLLVGFMLAVLSVHGSTKSATAVLVAVVPVMVLALPLADTSLSIARRWLRGAPVFGADERHLHHRLIAIGLTHRRAVLLLCVLAAGLAVLGLVLAFAPPRVVGVTAVAGAVALAVLLGVGVNRLEYHEFAEAGATLASASLRLRRAIQDQIHARDVAAVLRGAESAAQVRAILSDNAEALGFLSLELCRATDPDHARAALPSTGDGYPAWRLEYPVEAGGPDFPGGPWVLRLWCHQENGFRLLGTERAVKILAEAVREWHLAAARRPVALHGAEAREPRQSVAVS